MGTGIDHRSGRSCSTGGTVRACQAACCAVPEISTSPHSASSHSASPHSASRPPAVRGGCHHGGVTRPASPTPVSAVPRRMRLLCALAAALVTGSMLVAGLLLKSSSTGVVKFGTGDQVAVIGLGLVLGAGILLLGRARVDADLAGIRIRNIATRHELPWQVVRAVRFDRKSAWASLLLANDDEVAVLAVQAMDKERAVRAVEGLRALLAAARAREPAPPPLLHDD